MSRVRVDPIVCVVSVTSPDGELFESFGLTADDLKSTDWVGQQVVMGLPEPLRPSRS